jgi:hypothetical protein
VCSNANQLILNYSKIQNEKFERKIRQKNLDTDKQSQFFSILLGIVFGLIPQGIDIDNLFVSFLVGAILWILGGIIAPKKGDGAVYFWAVCSIFYFIFSIRYIYLHP